MSPGIVETCLGLFRKLGKYLSFLHRNGGEAVFEEKTGKLNFILFKPTARAHKTKNIEGAISVCRFVFVIRNIQGTMRATKMINLLYHQGQLTSHRTSVISDKIEPRQFRVERGKLSV